MKTLSEYINQELLECDGAATPGSTMGAGNPMAPGTDPTTPGSGDTFQTAKSKKEKKKIDEGLLDIDFDINDQQVAAGVCAKWAKELAAVAFTRDVDKYKSTRDGWMAELESMDMPEIDSSMLVAFRSKEYTIISFKPILNIKNLGAFKHAIEIRRFYKNPLPESISMFLDKNEDMVRGRFNPKTNHPTALDLKNNKIFLLPGEAYEDIKAEFKAADTIYMG